MTDVRVFRVRARPALRPRLGAVSSKLTTLGVVALLLCLWQLVAIVAFPDGDTLPRVTAIVRSLGDHRGIWWPNARHTLGPALKGLTIGVLIAVALSTLTVVFPFTERPVLRIAVAVHSLPIIAIGPILQVSLAGDATATALATLACVFTTLVALVGGLRAVPPNSGDIARGLGALPLQYFWKVRVPSALPSFFAALRIGFPAAVIGSMIGEFMGAPRGLAVLLIAFSSELDTPSTWATGVVITAISASGFALIGLAQRRITRFIPATAPAARSASGSGWRRVGAFFVTFGVAAGAMFFGWIAYLRAFDVDEFVGKRPSVVWDYLTSDATASGRDELYRALNQTLLDAGAGLLVGWGLAIAVAMSFVLWAPVERALMPVALAFRSVPILAVLPLLTLLFGRDLLGTVVIVSIIVFFPTLILVLDGLRSVPPDLLAISHAYDATPGDLLRKVRVPSALPAVFASLRIACPGAILGALLAEWLATGKGIGYLLLSATTRSAYDQLWAGTVLMTAIAVVAYTLTDAFERAVISRFAPPTRT
jgi:sulfonate transport system permease protein